MLRKPARLGSCEQTTAATKIRQAKDNSFAILYTKIIYIPDSQQLLQIQNFSPLILKNYIYV